MTAMINPQMEQTQAKINEEFLQQIREQFREDRLEARRQNAEIWKAIREVSQILSALGDRINGRKQ